jgi:hypothetical protein
MVSVTEYIADAVTCNMQVTEMVGGDGG